MNQVVDIRELNELIDRKARFKCPYRWNEQTDCWTKTLSGVSFNCCYQMDIYCWKVSQDWQRH